jgi:hypothetical protein
MRVYGQTIPRGFVYDNIVACAHRGPAFLDWDWAQTGSYMAIKVTMTTGFCNPGPPVARMYATVRFTVVT